MTYTPHKRFAVFTGILAWIALPLAGSTISYPNFSSTTGLTLNGTAAKATTSDGSVLRLTTAGTNESASAFNSNSITFANSTDTFSTFFQFRFTNPGGIAPADGIAFVLQPVSASLGAIGGAIGYGGIPNSIAVEFDTFNNALPDINDNHVAIDTGGNLNNLAAVAVGGLSGTEPCLAPTGVSGCMANGDLWSAWIDYDGTNLTVALADNSAVRPANIINQAIDVRSILGGNTAFAGITGGTGAGFENQDIIDWQYTNTFSPINPPTSNPEPATWALAILAMCPFVIHRLRRKRA